MFQKSTIQSCKECGRIVNQDCFVLVAGFCEYCVDDTVLINIKRNQQHKKVFKGQYTLKKFI